MGRLGLPVHWRADAPPAAAKDKTLTNRDSLAGRVLRTGKRHLKTTLQPAARAILPTVSNVASKPQAPAVPLTAPERWAKAKQPAAASSPSLITAVSGGGTLVPEFIADARQN